MVSVLPCGYELPLCFAGVAVLRGLSLFPGTTGKFRLPTLIAAVIGGQPRCGGAAQKSIECG